MRHVVLFFLASSCAGCLPTWFRTDKPGGMTQTPVDGAAVSPPLRLREILGGG